MGLSDTKGKLIYDFDLNTKGTLSVRFKPTSISTENRTIMMNKKDSINLFGVILKSDSKLYMVLNGTEYLVRNAVVSTDEWKTVVLTWNKNVFKVYDGFATLIKTASISLQGAKTIIGCDLDGFDPINHLNGQLEMLAYKGDVLDITRINRLFQNNHMMSIKTHVDILGRSKKDVIDTGIVKLEKTYTYKSPGSGKTSLQVESITKHDQSVVTYSYDMLGNVTSMTTPDGIYEYQYDYLNRLVREYNPVNQRTLIMAYSGNNNILSKKYYSGNQPLNVGGISQESYEYTYDPTWKDKLFSIVKKENGSVIDTKNFSYDSNFIGNPSQIGNKLLNWKSRKLMSINDEQIEYQYNECGVRTSKILNGTETIYELNGTSIIAEKSGIKTTRYHYNEKGLLVGFEYNDKQFYYIRDLLGVITEIVDENGFVMVSYKYDSWGQVINKVVINQTIDEVNHFVYKGYYLDNETGWYYLETRYYDSQNSRFINADNYKHLEIKSIIGINLYAYCGNNPVMFTDSTGCSPFWDAIGKTGLKITGNGLLVPLLLLV